MDNDLVALDAHTGLAGFHGDDATAEGIRSSRLAIGTGFGERIATHTVQQVWPEAF